MAALTEARATASKAVDRKFTLPVAASATIYAGGMVNINSSGYAVAATDSATDTRPAFGLALETVDNSSGSNGDKTVSLQEGIYLLGNDGLAQANVGGNALIKDDQTVGAANVNGLIAGTVIEYVSASEVWVLIKP